MRYFHEFPRPIRRSRAARAFVRARGFRRFLGRAPPGAARWLRVMLTSMQADIPDLRLFRRDRWIMCLAQYLAKQGKDSARELARRKVCARDLSSSLGGPGNSPLRVRSAITHPSPQVAYL